MFLSKLRKILKINKESILFNLFISRQIWYIGDFITLLILAFLYNGEGIGTLGVSKGIAGAISTISSFGVNEAFGSKGHSHTINAKQARILNELELFLVVVSLTILYLISIRLQRDNGRRERLEKSVMGRCRFFHPPCMVQI